MAEIKLPLSGELRKACVNRALCYKHSGWFRFIEMRPAESLLKETRDTFIICDDPVTQRQVPRGPALLGVPNAHTLNRRQLAGMALPDPRILYLQRTVHLYEMGKHNVS